MPLRTVNAVGSGIFILILYFRTINAVGSRIFIFNEVNLLSLNLELRIVTAIGLGIFILHL